MATTKDRYRAPSPFSRKQTEEKNEMTTFLRSKDYRGKAVLYMAEVMFVYRSGRAVGDQIDDACE